MKTIILISAMLILPYFAISQKGHGKGNGKGHSNGEGRHSHKKTSVVHPFNAVPVVYKSKKHKGPPYWAPANGYRHRNVYFPQYQCYYDSYNGEYIYLSNQRWIRAYSPPSIMVNVDLGLARKVELDVDVARPQIYFEQHIVLYPSFP